MVNSKLDGKIKELQAEIQKKKKLLEDKSTEKTQLETTLEKAFTDLEGKRRW